jgi:hypothetical protein
MLAAMNHGASRVASGPHVARSLVDERAMGNAGTNTPPFSPRLTTHDGRQFLAYWDHDGTLCVAARPLPDGAWRSHALDVDIGRRDGHWAPALGTGPAGHLFVSYNTRNSPIRWRRSESPGDPSSFGPETVGMTGHDEESACYPEFTRLRDGTLLFGYRDGMSGDGDWHLNRWDPEASAWRPQCRPVTAGEGARNAYHWNLVQSDDGRLHYFFCWRNNDLPGVGNENLCYARSADGGETWERSDGTTYDLPIRKATAEVVDPVETGRNFINQGWTTFDPRTDAPHVAYYRDDADGDTQVYHAFLADEDWVVEAVTDRAGALYRTDEFRSTDPKALGRPGIVVDDDGAVYVLTRDSERGGWPLLFSRVDGEWTVDVVTRRNVVHSDVHIDPERWRTDRVLSFVEQAQPNAAPGEGTVTPWADASPLAVTDVDPGRLAAADAAREPPVENPVPFLSAGLGGPAVVERASFRDTSASLVFSETAAPATPVLARCTATVNPGDADAVGLRLAFDDVARSASEDQSATGEAVTAAEQTVLTTGWVRVPDGIRAGTVTVQARAEAGAGELAAATLELAARDPRPGLDDACR